MYDYKYQKYKKKINQLGGKKENFYFIHDTNGYAGMTSILKSGEMKLGSEVSAKQRKWTGGLSYDNIFMTICFPEIQKIKFYLGLVFSQQLFYDYDLRVDAGWGNEPLVNVEKNETNKEKNKKLNKIKKYLKNPGSVLSKQVLDVLPDNWLNQVLFNERIPIDKYLVAIVGYCSHNNKKYDKESNKIKELLKKKNLEHVKCISTLEELDQI